MRMLQRVVDEFDRVYKRRKLKVNAGKSKVMAFERAKDEMISFAKPYRVRKNCIKGCEIWLGKERIEEVSEFKHIGTVLCKHGTLEGKMRERAVRGGR